MNQEAKSLDNITKKDLNDIQHFPGETGNPFDIVLQILDVFNKIPGFLYIILLAIASGIVTSFSFQEWRIFFIFAGLDWLIISLLPRLKVSFGPANSQSFLLFFMRSPFFLLPWQINIVLQLIGSFLVLWGFVWEPISIKISKQEMKVKANNDFEQVSFVHISDLHIEHIGRREFSLLRLLKELKPDFILFTGDFLNLSYREDKTAMERASDYFNKINDISPVFFVSGSPAVDLAETIKTICSSVDATHLDNRSFLWQKNDLKINLIGVNCSHHVHKDIKILDQISRTTADLDIFLYHSPDIIFELTEKDQVDLLLSGHTHGGQVQIPFFGAIFTGSLYGRILQNGLYHYKKTYLYISRGLGLEGLGAPRVRFLSHPEIVLWKIKSKEN